MQIEGKQLFEYVVLCCCYQKQKNMQCREKEISIDTINIIKTILGPNFADPDDDTFHRLCRNFTYDMHNKRSLMMNNESAYKLAMNSKNKPNF